MAPLWGMLAVLAVYLLILALLLGVGVGIGFALHWMLPAVELGTAILIGIVGEAIALHFLGRVLALIGAGPEDTLLDEEGLTPTVYVIPPTTFKPPRKKRPSR
jgi:hypothetical protein